MIISILLKVAEVIIPFPTNNSEKFKSDFVERTRLFFTNMSTLPRFFFSIMLTIIQLSTVLRYLRPFSRLPIEKRKKVIEKWYTSKIMTKRLMIRALKGLCTMIYMGLARPT